MVHKYNSDIPIVPWADFYETLDWKQGEHVSVFGRTGSGKTYLTTDLLNIRTGYTVAFGVKAEDESLDYLIEHEGYQRITQWPPKPDKEGRKRFLLWPHLNSPDDIDAAEPLFRDAISQMFTQRGWTIYVDEVRYMATRMGLGKILGDIWTLGRSSNLTLVGSSQRPTWVPLEMLTQATHIFLFPTNGQEDIKRLQALDVKNRNQVIEAVGNLPRFHCLYLNTVTGEMLVTQASKR